MPDSAAVRNRTQPSNRGRPELNEEPPRKRTSPAGKPERGVTTERIVRSGRPPGPPPPTHPIRRHGPDMAAIALAAAGLLLLLSLRFGGASIHLGTILWGLLGWGAPACGIMLLVLSGIVAAGPHILRAGEVRAGIVLLFVGFLAFTGLLGIDAAGHGGHGGDAGHLIAAGLRGVLQPLLGKGAWYPSAHVLVAAFNLVSFLVLTGRPLSHWGRLSRGLGHRAGQKVAQGVARRSYRPAEPEPLPISDTTRTRRSRQRPALELPGDSITTSRTGARADAEASSAGSKPTSDGLSPLPGADDAHAVPEAESGTTTDGRPTRLTKTSTGRSLRSGLVSALDTLLPAAVMQPEDTAASAVGGPAADESALPGVEADAATPAGISLEEAIQQDNAVGPGMQAAAYSVPSQFAEDDLIDPTEEEYTQAFSVGQLTIPEKFHPTGGERDVDDPDEAGPDEVEERANGENRGNGKLRVGETPLPLRFPDVPLPPASLLNDTPPAPRKTEEEARATVMTLERTLQEFKVEARVVEIAEGPTLTRYEIQLAPGILVKRIVSLADNIAMALAAIDVRVEAPIPGKSAIGVEIPKRNPGVVGLREMVETPEFQRAPRLSFALGRDVTGTAQYADLARMPHLLIAGSTGAGKSACLNALITSLLYRAEPEDLQFVMIDPKRVELSLYDGIPHLCHQIVRDSRKAPQALGRVMAEMDRRYLLLQNARTRDITGYNLKAETPAQKLPYIVVVIDELADLMMTSGAETEHGITRLAQLSRAVGIHLVVATQRPSVDIVTGKIKANVSSRIAFAVSSGIDSRTILDCNGAERLIGRGDMLFLPMDASKPRRIQGAYISEQELERVVEFWRSRGRPDYYLERIPTPDAELEPTGDAEDELYTEAVRVVIAAGQASTSMIQRRLKIGYNRAATLVELMEQHGVVGAQDGVRPREVLISRDQWDLARSE